MMQCWWKVSAIPVHVVEGSAMSLKITTPLDLLLAEAVLSGGSSMQED